MPKTRKGCLNSTFFILTNTKFSSYIFTNFLLKNLVRILLSLQQRYVSMKFFLIFFFLT